MKYKIFISTSSFGKYSHEALELMSKNDCEYKLNPFQRKLSTEEIKEFLLKEKVVGLIAGTENINVDVLSVAKTLKVISRCGTGLDNVDLKAAGEYGIKVYNTPDAPTDAVAELTVALMLDCLRLISRTDRNIRRGIWEKPMGTLLKSKHIGIIGYGRIGRALSRLMQAFGAKVLAYDICPIVESQGARIVSFEELISNADIVSLHMPANDDKKYVIDVEVISRMKKGAYLFNVSRGGLVDENALYEALHSGKLAGAGIDTFASEPYEGKLKELENVVLTSHIGSYAKDARILMEKQAVENLLKGLEVK